MYLSTVLCVHRLKRPSRGSFAARQLNDKRLLWRYKDIAPSPLLGCFFSMTVLEIQSLEDFSNVPSYASAWVLINNARIASAQVLQPTNNDLLTSTASMDISRCLLVVAQARHSFSLGQWPRIRRRLMAQASQTVSDLSHFTSPPHIIWPAFL